MLKILGRVSFWFISVPCSSYSVYSPSPDRPDLPFRNVRRTSNFAQVGMQYIYVQLCMYVEESPDENGTHTHWNLISRKITVPPPALPQKYYSPLPHLSPCALFNAREIWDAF